MFNCIVYLIFVFFFFFQAEDGIRDLTVTGVRRVLFRSARAQGGEVCAAAGPDGGTTMRLTLRQAAAAGDGDGAETDGSEGGDGPGHRKSAPPNGRRVPPMLSRPLLPRQRTPSDDSTPRP